MSVYVVRHKGTHVPQVTDRYLDSPNGHLGCSFRKAYRFDTLEEAQREAAKYPSWREVVRVKYKRVVRRVPQLKVMACQTIQ